MISSRQAYILITLFIAITCFFSCAQKSTMTSSEQVTLNALIIDGENNHGIWPMTTMMLKDYLEETGKFTVAIKRKKYTWQGPHSDGDPTIGKKEESSL
jgi:hypothetical protein